MPSTESWFETVEGDALQQGDFFAACPSPIIPEDLPTDIKSKDEIPLAFELYNAVILTQSCDLVSKNPKRVMLCPHWPLSKFHQIFGVPEWSPEAMKKIEKKAEAKRENLQREHEGLSEKQLDKLADDYQRRVNARDSFLENLRRGGQNNIHMLAACELDDFGAEIQLVDFKSTFILPFAYLKNRAVQGKRLRLKSPYREHLSQAFARYFMRVGLPSDVPPFKK